ncbi:uncharacterized protein L201_003992 [Kwoniella dendrophila CBS 6074]|uniref:Uncharacterized protein n=1 Tax=Kwoniella dendrophila CBS 6074 TaxID=1295534 RepID=A0AAX4JW29_9TREE
MPNSRNGSFQGSYPVTIEDKTRLKEIDNQIKEEEKGDLDHNATHILSGTPNFALPSARVQGTAPPLSVRPYQLSKGYSHLVESPEKYRHIIADKLGKLQTTLPQLGSDDLRQAKADIVYLRSILEDDDQDIAQIKAGANWASRDA